MSRDGVLMYWVVSISVLIGLQCKVTLANQCTCFIMICCGSFGSNEYNTFDTGVTIGQIYQTDISYEGYCLAAYCDETDCDTYGARYENETALTVWEYSDDTLQFRLYGSVADFNDQFSESNSESNSESDDSTEDTLCLRVGYDIVRTINPSTGLPGWGAKRLYIQQCDDIQQIQDLEYAQ